MIGQTIAHYRITERLGSGGMGEVYLAEDTKLDRQVALKFLPSELANDADARQRLLREAKAASKLNHPNILTIYSVEVADGRDFIAMEYVAGKNLSDYVAARSPSIEERLALAVQIAEGLVKAHAAGVLHRDIKPSNILVDTDGHAKILDFGLATFRGAARLTQTGSTMGTAAYMSPEQAGSRECDQRSDLFSLGVVIYEMITGRLPFQGTHSAALMYAILNEEPEPLARYASGVPDELRRIISKCLVKNAAERYQSAGDLIADLKHLLRVTSSGSAPAAAPRRRMLAVLPFENLGPADDEYFADGMTEEIISRLASVTGLGVISRTSAMQYKGTRKSIREIGSELSVDFVLEGTVRWSKSGQGPSRVRITPQLIRVNEDTHMWSERYDRVIEDIFDVQSEIAEKVTGQLNVTLGEPEKKAIDVKPTENMDAYYAYLRGLEYVGRPDYSAAHHRSSIQMFERAVELDDHFSQAHAYLAISHAGMYFYGYERTSERMALAKKAAERARALRPDDPVTRLAWGFYYYRCVKDLPRALLEFQKSLELQPNNTWPLFLTSAIHRRQGLLAESLEGAKKVIQLDPLRPSFSMEAGITAMLMRRYDEAERFLDRSISLTPDQSNAYTWKAMLHLFGRGDVAAARKCLESVVVRAFGATFWEWLEILTSERDFTSALAHVKALPTDVYEDQSWYSPKSQLAGAVYSLMGDQANARIAYEEALPHLEQMIRERPDDARVRVSIAYAYAGLDRANEAIEQIGEAVRLVPMDMDAIIAPMMKFHEASICMRTGNHARAIDLLEYVLSIPTVFSPAYLRINPFWDALRDNPRFQRLLEQAPKVF